MYPNTLDNKVDHYIITIKGDGQAGQYGHWTKRFIISNVLQITNIQKKTK